MYVFHSIFKIFKLGFTNMAFSFITLTLRVGFTSARASKYGLGHSCFLSHLFNFNTITSRCDFGLKFINTNCSNKNMTHNIEIPEIWYYDQIYQEIISLLICIGNESYLLKVYVGCVLPYQYLQSLPHIYINLRIKG